MNQDIVSMSPNDDVKTAAFLMKKYNIGCVPILSDLKIIGLLTDRDIVVRCLYQNTNTSLIKVSQIMTTDLVFIKETDTISKALKVMTAKKVMRLPVISLFGSFSGIISFSDIASLHAGPEVALTISNIAKRNTRKNQNIKTM